MIFVISGPSASGKTTLVQHVRNIMPEVEFSISCTTRPERPQDKNDAHDYDFVDRETFERRVQEGYFAEWADVHGNCYGTPWNQINKASSTSGGTTDVILDVDVKGARNIKERFPEAVLIFVVPPSIDELKNRLKRRNTETDESISQRLASLREELSVIEQYDYIIVNNTIEDSQREIEAAIDIFRTRKARIDNVREEYSG